MKKGQHISLSSLRVKSIRQRNSNRRWHKFQMDEERNRQSRSRKNKKNSQKNFSTRGRRYIKKENEYRINDHQKDIIDIIFDIPLWILDQYQKSLDKIFDTLEAILKKIIK
jgi:hypothetical protein